MRILTYDELECKEELFPLFYRAFGHPFDPWRFEEDRAKDPVFKDGLAAFCAVVDGTLAGIVGVLEIPTRTVGGEEVVGGLWSVITHPAFPRQGIAAALMERAHQYYKERSIRLVFLTTNSSWGAHRLYRKLGYQDVAWPTTRMAYKVLPSDSARQTSELQSATEKQVAALFQRFTADRTGFVLRPANFLELRLRSPSPALTRELCLQTEGGYVLANQNRGGTDILEMVAVNVEAQHTLLSALEGQGSYVEDRMVISDALAKGYRERGYLSSQGSYDVLMAKALEPGVSVERLYGDAFYISLMVQL